MAIALYMDVHIPLAITIELQRRGIDVLTSQQDSTTTMPDDELLDRATQLDRILVTFDDDLLTEATRRQRENIYFAGVIFGKPLQLSIGRIMQDLEIIALAGDLPDIENQVQYLPL